MCGVTREKFYARYHETESGRTGHLKEIGERWKCRSGKKSVSVTGGLERNISLSLFFCDTCATICIHPLSTHLRLYRRGGSFPTQ